MLLYTVALTPEGEASTTLSEDSTLVEPSTTQSTEEDFTQSLVEPSMTESPSFLSISQPCNDIGNITDASSLSNAEKYSVLFEHVTPPLTLPTTFSHGCNCRFNTKWLQKYPWPRYSPKLDAVLCGACALLMKSDVRQDKGWLVNKPFSNWVKLSDMLSNHSKLL